MSFTGRLGEPARDGLPFVCAGVAFLIEDALSESLCLALKERATVLGFGPTGDDYPPSYRNNDRRVYDDADLAAALFARLGARLPAQLTGEDGSSWTLCGLNSRFRFCRYRDGQGFRIHQDGAHEPAPGLRSLLTLQIYLDDDPARLGGQTRFYAARRGGLQGGVTPRPGRAIVFEHRLWHDGEPVTAGEKHVLRTDAMYQRQGSPVAPARRVSQPVEGAPAIVLPLHDGYVFSLLTLPSGELVSGSRDRSICICDPASGRPRLRLSGHHGSVSSLCFLPSTPGGAAGYLLSGGRDHALLSHDLSTGESVRLAELPGAVLSLADCSPLYLAAGCGDGGIWLWPRSPWGHDSDDAGCGPALVTAAPSGCLRPAGGWVWALLPQPGGRLVSGSEDGCVRLWDLASQRLLGELPLAHGPVHALCNVTAAGGAFIAGCADGHLVWLDFASDPACGLRERGSYPAHQGEVYALCALAEDVIVSAGEDGCIALSRIGDGVLQAAAEAPLAVRPSFVRCLARLADGRLAAGDYQGQVALLAPRFR